MWRARACAVGLVGLAWPAWILPAGAVGLGSDSAAAQATFHSSADLVLVDVIAQSSSSGIADTTLKREDFQLFDNGRAVSIQSFDQGTQSRPIALWLVVQCNMRGWAEKGSGLFAGHIDLFAPALKHLGERNTAAVADWCDDGRSEIALRPTTNAAEAISALDRALAPIHEVAAHGRTGELALQRTLQLVIDASRQQEPKLTPVIVFLYGDWSAMPKSEAQSFADAADDLCYRIWPEGPPVATDPGSPMARGRAGRNCELHRD